MVDMFRYICFLLTFAVCSSATLSTSRCQAEPRQLDIDTAPPEVTPWQDDANLHDVQFVSKNLGWAVGDHGIIWHTADGGENWAMQTSPIKCSLQHLCFLTDQVGWIAGGGVGPYGQGHFGVVLHTRDGGQTWKQLADGSVPMLSYIRFFGLKQGVAVGLPNVRFPNGIMQTSDGGQTWQPFQGAADGSWRAAEFYQSKSGKLQGALAGRRGLTQLASGIELLPNNQQQPSLRGYYDIDLAPDHEGWMVGDGGSVLHTPNGGVTWKSPPAALPEELRHIVDFKTVTTYKDHVWIAGSPGSVIWHSANWGESWEQQRTDQSLPIHQLYFQSEDSGWAVGALGQILKTDNGGQTWTIIRGQGRRLAMLSIQSRTNQISFLTLAKQAGDLGYRSLAFLPARHDIGSSGYQHKIDDINSHQAVLATGGAGASIDWQLPIVQPDIEHNYQHLVADLQRRTEGQLPSVMLSKLVSVIRTWRPAVIVLNQPAEDDATTQLLNEAVQEAVRRAARADSFPEQNKLAGLRPWSVQRIWQKLPASSVGEVNIDPYQNLPRLNATAQETAAPARSMVLPKSPLEFEGEAYRTIYDANSDNAETKSKRFGFFNGLGLLPDSDARRVMLHYDIEQQKNFNERIRKQRNIQSITEHMLKQPEMASQMIAHIDQISEGLTNQQAAFQLSQLAEKYRQRAHWQLAESTSIEIINRYPQEPIALETMQWLIHLWGGAEPVWQRIRKPSVRKSTLQLDRDLLVQRLDNAIKQMGTDPRLRSNNQLDEPDPLSVVQTSGEIRADRSPTEQMQWKDKESQHWQSHALKMASLVRRVAPNYYLKPEIQFPIASVLRKRGAYRIADNTYREFPAGSANDPWKQTAEGELWTVHKTHLPPKPMVAVRRTRKRPHLDGLLSDECWQNANEFPLSREAQDESSPNRSGSIVLLSYDNDFLYIAASLPMASTKDSESTERQIRKYDADLTNQDRLKLWIDIDRDYATWYSLAVDERGQTADSCWTDASWNPEWYVKADADNTHWRIEAAIKLEELSPMPPGPGTVWALGISRIIPNVAVQSWTHPASSEPRPEAFGLVTFQ